MVVLLLLAILVVLILGFWSKEGLAFLMIIGVGALVLMAPAILLMLFGISVGSVLLLWNSNVVPFWNVHKAILEPPLVSIVIISIYIFAAIKFLRTKRTEIKRTKIVDLYISNDTISEKFIFLFIGVPSLLVFYGFVLVVSVIPIVFMAQEMQKWWLVISPKF
jgi:hypothetical protein